MIQNIGLALFPLAVAQEYNREGRYIPGVEMLFVTFGVLGSIVGVMLNVLDYQNGLVLNRSHQSCKTTLPLDDDTTDTESLLASEY